jgi:hypothetical protein
MNRTLRLIALLAIAAANCGGSPAEETRSKVKEVTPTEAAATPSGCEGLPLNEFEIPEGSPVLRNGAGTVSAQANIFAAGRDAAPSPGGGGSGVLPPVMPLPDATSRVVTVSSVEGQVTHWKQETGFNSAAGDGIGPIDVKSLQGISGIVHRTNRTFLVGVFLTDDPPSDPAPPRLDFSDTELSLPGVKYVGDQFDELAPEIGQTFLVGDGKGRTYLVPDEATRFFLGFADARLWVGCPGWYSNNDGHLNVAVEVRTP